LSAAAAHDADVDVVGTFAEARTSLDDVRFDLLVANLRLGEYNGIHLAYLVRLAGAQTHVLVHADACDAASAGDIRRAGALLDRTERLVVALPAYVSATLPPVDRRDPLRFDRRRFTRGGRRARDRRPLDASSDPA
jgi:hypothetical protein